ncbi:MAG: hypothetical protein AAFQ22_10635 [Pseudomonadota bacterium]
MTEAPELMVRTLQLLRGNVLRSAEFVQEAGWQDLEEAVADIDVTLAALELGRPEGWSRACVLLGNEGPVQLLSSLNGWETDFMQAVSEIEPAVAAQ